MSTSIEALVNREYKAGFVTDIEADEIPRGLSEETDALLIIVSEENGSIAVAREGVLREGLNRDSLLASLKEHFGDRD